MQFLVQQRNKLLLLLIVLVCCGFPVAQQLQLDQTIDSFFPPDNPDIVLLKRSRSEFGGDEFVVIAWQQPNLITVSEERDIPQVSDSAQQHIDALASAVNEIPGVDPAGTRHLPLFLDRAPKSRNTRNGMISLFEGLLISRDRSTTAIIVQLRPADSSPEPRSQTIRSIRAAVQQFRKDAVVAGEPVLIQDMFDLVERDGTLLYGVSLVVLTGVLLLIFRGIRWAFASVMVVVASVVCTRAFLVLTGLQLSMVSSVLNSLLTVISIATAMHVIVHYRELRHTLAAVPAAEQALADMARPVFWTAVTTAVGFGALLISDIVPVRSFSTMMASGVLTALVCLALVLPATLASGKSIRRPGDAPAEPVLSRFLTRLANVVAGHPWLAGGICFGLVAITAPGLWRLRIDSDFSHNFRDSSEIVRAVAFVESHLGPAGTWEVTFDAPEPLTAAFLDDAERLTEKLRELNTPETELSVLSLNDAIDIPPRLGDARRRLDRLSRRQQDLVDSLYSQDSQRMRIVLRSREQQPSEQKLQQIAAVRDLVADHFAAEQRTAEQYRPEQVTASGLFVLMARVVDSLLRDQLNSFLVATLGILICMTIAFRSLRTGLISLLPNIFPVVVVLGALGMLDIPINMGTAMLASVSMGLTVDSTIHYITAFERARQTQSVAAALQTAHAGAGRAVVFAHLALVAGFMVLTVSSFVPLIYFGALMSLSMISGIVGDLVLLPLFLRWTTRETTTASTQ
jgi:predicted RND superfamily exporter protein